MTDVPEPEPSRAPILELREVSKRYGSLVAVNEVSLSVPGSERHALIGPNGAGKTTLFHLIAGTIPVSGGRILFKGRDITRLSEHRRAQLGIARTFQQSSLFNGLTAADNVSLALQRVRGVGHRMLRSVDRYPEMLERARELLEAVGLGGREDAIAGALSHGERRELEVALALATEPPLILLDEPTAGMSGSEAERFIAMIGGLPASTTLLIVEHDMDTVFAVANRITVLAAGRVLAQGRPEEIRGSQPVRDAYLGGEREEELFTR